MHILDWNAFDYGNNFCFPEWRWGNLARNPNKICHHHKPKKVITTTDFKCEKEKWKRCNQNPGKLFVGFEPDNYIGLQDYAKFQLLDFCLLNSACQLPRLLKNQQPMNITICWWAFSRHITMHHQWFCPWSCSSKSPVSSLPYSYLEWAMGQWQGHVKEDSCSNVQNWWLSCQGVKQTPWSHTLIHEPLMLYLSMKSSPSLCHLRVLWRFRTTITSSSRWASTSAKRRLMLE